MDSLHHVPPPPALSGLSRPELEALLVELFGEVAALKQTNSDLREEIARLKGSRANDPLFADKEVFTGDVPTDLSANHERYLER